MTKKLKQFKYKLYLESVVYLFVVLVILFLPFSFDLFPYQLDITTFVFGNIIELIKPFVFDTIMYSELSSDSSSLYTLVILLFGLSFILALGFLKLREKFNFTLKFIHIILCYYLAVILMKYGVEKLLLLQFYKPQANILFTPFGYLDRDILFWSTIGTSKLYNFSIGFVQVFTAILLLFKRTRFVGLLIAVTVFSNIVIINFSFDISVKLLSCFLLFCSLVGLLKYKSIFITLYSTLKENIFGETPIIKSKFVYAFVKVFVILLFVYESVGSLASPKDNEYVGAYQIESVTKDSVLLKDYEFKRFFIHNKDYFIFQNKEEEMIDYKLEIVNSSFILKNYNNKIHKLNFIKRKDTLELMYIKGDSKYIITSRKINLDSLPVNKQKFHLTIDEIE